MRPPPRSRSATRSAQASESSRSRGASRGTPDEVAQDLLAFLGQDRLRVELDTVGREPHVAQAHDGAVVCPRGDHEVVGYRRPLDDQGVISGGLERVGDARHHTRVVMADPRSLAVRGPVAHDFPAARLADALVAAAYAQDSNLSVLLLDPLVVD